MSQSRDPERIQQADTKVPVANTMNRKGLLWSRPTFTIRPTAAWATRCGCCPAPTDSLEPIPSVDAEKRGDRKGEPDERQYDHCNSNDKRPEQIFPRSLRRRVDRVELPVLLIESFDNVIHRITSCTP